MDSTYQWQRPIVCLNQMTADSINRPISTILRNLGWSHCMFVSINEVKPLLMVIRNQNDITPRQDKRTYNVKHTNKGFWNSGTRDIIQEDDVNRIVSETKQETLGVIHDHKHFPKCTNCTLLRPLSHPRKCTRKIVDL